MMIFKTGEGRLCLKRNFSKEREVFKTKLPPPFYLAASTENPPLLDNKTKKPSQFNID